MKLIIVILIIVILIINNKIVVSSRRLPPEQNEEAIRLLKDNLGIVTDDPCFDPLTILCVQVDIREPDLYTVSAIRFYDSIIELEQDPSSTIKILHNVHSWNVDSNLKVFPDLTFLVLTGQYTISSNFFQNLQSFKRLIKVEITTHNEPILGDVELPPTLVEIKFGYFNTEIPSGFFTSGNLESFTIFRTTKDNIFPNIRKSNRALSNLNVPVISNTTVSFEHIANSFLGLQRLGVHVGNNFNCTMGKELPTFTRSFNSLKNITLFFPDNSEKLSLVEFPKSMNILKTLQAIQIVGRGFNMNCTTGALFDFQNLLPGLHLYINVDGDFSSDPNQRSIVSLPKNTSLVFDHCNFLMKFIDFTNVTSFLMNNNSFEQPLLVDNSMSYDKFTKFVIENSNTVGPCPKEYGLFGPNVLNVKQCGKIHKIEPIPKEFENSNLDPLFLNIQQSFDKQDSKSCKLLILNTNLILFSIIILFI